MAKLLAANFKMNPRTAAEAVRLAKSYDKKDVVVALPFPFIATVGSVLKNAALGAQDIFWENEGAYTGEVSPIQLKSFGVRYVIIGHSERRALGETDVVVNKKVKAALSAGLRTILCVGEPLAVRRKGLAAAERFVQSQLATALAGTAGLKLTVQNLVIAYEPIWAIGTGRAAMSADAVAMAQFIKKFLKTKTHNLKPRVLYGGSVNAGNIGLFLSEPDIDGALVGGASLKIREFKKMILANQLIG